MLESSSLESQQADREAEHEPRADTRLDKISHDIKASNSDNEIFWTYPRVRAALGRERSRCPLRRGRALLRGKSPPDHRAALLRVPLASIRQDEGRLDARLARRLGCRWRLRTGDRAGRPGKEFAYPS